MAITNAKIIESYKAENGIPMEKPLFTYAVWRSMGYQVKRGEASRHRVQMWKYIPGAGKADTETQEAPQSKGNRCFMKTVCLFEAGQVDMKNFYMAVCVKTVSEMTDSPEGYYAYRVKFSSSDNLKSVLDRIGGLKAANMCATKKEADELVKMWNETFKENGVYVY